MFGCPFKAMFLLYHINFQDLSNSVECRYNVDEVSLVCLWSNDKVLKHKLVIIFTPLDRSRKIMWNQKDKIKPQTGIRWQFYNFLKFQYKNKKRLRKVDLLWVLICMSIWFSFDIFKKLDKIKNNQYQKTI